MLETACSLGEIVYTSILSFPIIFDNLYFIMFTVPLHLVSESQKQIFVVDRHNCGLDSCPKKALHYPNTCS